MGWGDFKNPEKGGEWNSSEIDLNLAGILLQTKD
mgnify:CR=1 FL=1